MRGISGSAGYVPYRRLARSAISAFLGSGGGESAHSVASRLALTHNLGGYPGETVSFVSVVDTELG